jgi:hypothetical protein
MQLGVLMKSVVIPSVLLGLWLGCTNPTSTPKAIGNDTPSLTPIMAIEGAASNPLGLPGTFEMQVRRADYGDGPDKGLIFLNSEDDYRDRRCLTLRIQRSVVHDFESRGIDPLGFFKNKRIKVEGRAKQIKIYFVSDRGIQSKKYYYQTHIAITSADQISVIPAT